MKVIKIQGSENKHVKYLYNRIMPLMSENKCGGVYTVDKGDVKINAWCDKVAENIKNFLNELKIKFIESEE